MLDKAFRFPGATVEGDRPHRKHARQRTFKWTGQGVVRTCAVALVLGVTIWLSYLGHAYSSEIGMGERDEAAHYMNGILVRDYVAKGMPGPALEFAGKYYLHYPKIAFGVWPPFFCVLEGIWMLILSPLTWSVLLLMAVITSLSAFTLFEVARKELGLGLAVITALSYVALPDVQISSNSVMIDGLVAALELLAVLHLARYIETERSRYAYAFGAIASVAVLSKLNALALVAVPFIAVCLSGKWTLLRRKAVWVSVALPLAVCLPWIFFLLQFAAKNSHAMKLNFTSAITRAWYSPRAVVFASGVFAPLAAVGVWHTVLRRYRSRRVTPIWGSLSALIAGVILFHIVLPHDLSYRYFLSTVAALLLFASAGIRYVAGNLPLRISSEWRTAIVAAASCAAFFLFQFRIPSKPSIGLEPIARRLAGESTPRVALACGSATMEGAAVATIAMWDLRPRHFVLRAGKVLARSDWYGSDYTALFESPGAIAAYLDSVPVDYVLLEPAAPEFARPDQRLLAAALEQNKGTWKRDDSAGGRLQFWRRVKPLTHGPPKFTVSLQNTLHRSLSSQ